MIFCKYCRKRLHKPVTWIDDVNESETPTTILLVNGNVLDQMLQFVVADVVDKERIHHRCCCRQYHRVNASDDGMQT